MKLLLVEDSPATQTTTQCNFERRGMQVVACGDGARACDHGQASLPGLAGLEAIVSPPLADNPGA